MKWMSMVIVGVLGVAGCSSDPSKITSAPTNVSLIAQRSDEAGKPPAPPPWDFCSFPEVFPVVMPLTASDEGAIVFASDRGGNFDIYRMKPDGSDVAQLTDDPAEDTMPSASPDGGRIAFVSDRQGQRGLFIMNADGSNVRKVVENAAEAAHVSWTPDGQRIVCDLQVGTRMEIHVMNTDGTNVRKLLDDGMMPSCSPDGKAIAFNRGQLPQLYLMDFNGGNVRPLLKKDRPGGFLPDLAPVWSPDGKKVLYTAVAGVAKDDAGDQALKYEIRVAGADGRNIKPLLRINGMALAWSPDSSRILFFDTMEGNTDLYVMNADGTGVKRLTEEPSEEMWGSWAAPALSEPAVNPSPLRYEYKEYAWKNDEPPLRMIHKDEGFCMLTEVNGAFTGGAERARVFISDDGYWYLHGATGRGLLIAKALSVKISLRTEERGTRLDEASTDFADDANNPEASAKD